MSGKYLAGRKAFGEGDLSWTRDRIVAQLVSGGYSFNETQKESDSLTGKVGEPVELLAKTIADGWAKSSRIIFSEITGPDVVGIVFHRQMVSGKSKPNTLIAYSDAIEGFPMTPNGGDIEVEVPGLGIFRI